MAGVEIGDRLGHVRDVLGSPDRVIPPAWAYGTPLDGRVGFGHRRKVNDIWTTSSRQQTNKGIGPGDSAAEVKRAYPEAKCYEHGRQRVAICVLRTTTRKRVVETDFFFRGGSVQRVEVFLVPSTPRRRPA
jgi:hypothetical protein